MKDVKFKKITNSSDCFSCATPCCRFLSKDAYFAPIATDLEMEKINSILENNHFKKFKDSKNVFQVVLKEDGQDVSICPFLDKVASKCVVYEHRPLDCSLWPFLFTKKENGDIFLAHMKNTTCPSLASVGEKYFFDYVDYIKDFLKKNKIFELIKKYPDLAWEWEEDFEIIKEV